MYTYTCTCVIVAIIFLLAFFTKYTVLSASMLKIFLKSAFFVAVLGFMALETAFAQVAPMTSATETALHLGQKNLGDSSLLAEQWPIAEALDSLMQLHLFDNKIVPSQRPINKYGYRPDEVPRFSDSVISFRIQHIPSPMKLAYNAHVRGFIELYAVRRKAASERMLGLANYYFPIFEEALERHGLPHQLKYLAIVESALNPVAVSRVGATGLWQFMYPTGKQYGLDADYYCDERRDPWLASDAAARHLKDLHRIYNDWLLALAAYNCGAGNVNKAVRRSGGLTDYWSLMPYLPQETRGYVPAFVAVTYIMHYAAEHNLNPVRYTGLPDHIDTLHLKGPLSLPALAAQLGMSTQEMCLLNPQFKQQEIPRSFESYPIRLPVAKVAEFERNRSPILAALQPAPIMMPAVDGNTSPMYAQGSQPNQPSSTAGGEWVSKPSRYHTVRRGETLSTIGRRYGISVQSLRSWNHLSGSSIGVGQKLIVQRATAVPAAVASATSSTPTAVSTDTLAEAEVAQDVAASREANTASRPSNPAVRQVPTYNYYTVRKGDTLWDIAQRKGITVAELQKANKLTKSSRLQPGQRLKIAAG